MTTTDNKGKDEVGGRTMKSIINKRNGIIGGAIIAFILIAIIVSTSFSSAMNLDEAKEIAQKHVPSTAKFVTSEEEDRYFEVAFYDENNKEKFEVEVNKETREVKKVESQLSNDLGSEKITLSEDEVKNIVKKRFPGAASITVVLTKDNNLFEYEASFKGDGFYGDAEINAETGAVLDSVIKYGTVVTIPADESTEEKMLSYEEAKDAVIKEAGGGAVRDIDLDKENKDYFYEVELHIDHMERDYIVNANTGEVMLEGEHKCYFEHHHDENPSQKEDNGSQQAPVESQPVVEEPVPSVTPDSQGGSDAQTKSDIITETEAKNIVLAKIPGAQFVSFFLDRDDGRQVYEGKAQLDGFEYEFEINASSGVITDWDKERIEKYDDDDDWDDNEWDD